MKDQLSQKTIAEDLYIKLDDYHQSNVCRLFDDIWNQNQVPYIIGAAKAAKTLDGYKQDMLDYDLGSNAPEETGVFAAMGLVKAFYNNEIGEKPAEDTLTNPEKLAHEVSLIRARHIINNLESLQNGEDEGIDNQDTLTDSRIKRIQKELRHTYKF